MTLLDGSHSEAFVVTSEQDLGVWDLHGVRAGSRVVGHEAVQPLGHNAWVINTTRDGFVLVDGLTGVTRLLDIAAEEPIACFAPCRARHTETILLAFLTKGSAGGGMAGKKERDEEEDPEKGIVQVIALNASKPSLDSSQEQSQGTTTFKQHVASLHLKSARATSTQRNIILRWNFDATVLVLVEGCVVTFFQAFCSESGLEVEQKWRLHHVASHELCSPVRHIVWGNASTLFVATAVSLFQFTTKLAPSGDSERKSSLEGKKLRMDVPAPREVILSLNLSRLKFICSSITECDLEGESCHGRGPASVWFVCEGSTAVYTPRNAHFVNHDALLGDQVSPLQDLLSLPLSTTPSSSSTVFAATLSPEGNLVEGPEMALPPGFNPTSGCPLGSNELLVASATTSSDVLCLAHDVQRNKITAISSPISLHTCMNGLQKGMQSTDNGDDGDDSGAKGDDEQQVAWGRCALVSSVVLNSPLAGMDENKAHCYAVLMLLRSVPSLTQMSLFLPPDANGSPGGASKVKPMLFVVRKGSDDKQAASRASRVFKADPLRALQESLPTVSSHAHGSCREGESKEALMSFIRDLGAESAKEQETAETLARVAPRTGGMHDEAGFASIPELADPAYRRKMTASLEQARQAQGQYQHRQRNAIFRTLGRDMATQNLAEDHSTGSTLSSGPRAPHSSPPSNRHRVCVQSNDQCAQPSADHRVESSGNINISINVSDIHSQLAQIALSIERFRDDAMGKFAQIESRLAALEEGAIGGTSHKEMERDG